MYKFLTIAILALTACKNKSETQFPVLEEKKVSIVKSDYTEKNNLIEQMWAEVKKKENAAIDIEIDSKRWEKILSDSLEAWNHFIQKNQEYYDLVPIYLGKIQDTILRKYYTKYFDSLKTEFLIEVDSLTILSKKLEHQKLELNDLIIQLKLRNTHNMLKEYQQIQIPDKSPLEKIVAHQDSVIRYYRLFLSNDSIQPFQ